MAGFAIVKSLRDALTPIFQPAGTLIANVTPGSWASPQNPIRPTEQLGTDLRQWNYTPGINLNFTPRGDQKIKFHQLWNVSNSFDLCRLVIEKRKNAISNREWSIRVKRKPGETKKALLDRESQNPNVKFLTTLMQRPDGIHPFPLWARMWVEEMLVFDAPTVYPVINMLGGLLHLRLISGTTITPMVDQFGCRPEPPSPAYQQIIQGIPTMNVVGQAREFSGPIGNKRKPGDPSELFYQPKNPRVNSRWGFPPTEQLLVTLSIAANRQQFFRDYYTAGNIPDALAQLPEGWTPQQIKDFQKWFDSMLAGNLQARRKVWFIPETKGQPTMTKKEALTDATDEYLNRMVAYCFGESPQALVKAVGHQSTAKEGNDQAQSQGLETDLAHLAVSINDIFLAFGYDDCEFGWEDEDEMDPVKSATVSDLRLRNGSITLNQDRNDRGEDPYDIPEADQPGIYTPTGWMPIEAGAASARQEALAPPELEPDPDEPPNGPKGGGAQHTSKARVLALKRSQLRIDVGELTPKARQARQDAKRVLQKFLGDQKLRIAKAAADAYGSRRDSYKVRKADGDDSTLETDTDRALAILAMLQWDYPTLYRALQPYLEIAAEEGASAGAFQVAAHLGANLSDTLGEAVPAAKRAANDRAAEMVGLEVQDDGTIAEATAPAMAISDTAKDDALATIKQAIKEDWTPDQLEAVLQASVVFSQDHGDLIADEEIVSQQANGHLIAWIKSKKITKLQWMVQPNACSVCVGFNLLGPVDPGYHFGAGIMRPPAHPSCRCSLVAVEFAEE